MRYARAVPRPLALALALVAVPATASADGYAEFVGGGGLPLGGGEHSESISSTLRAGVRLGLREQRGDDYELAIDYAFLDLQPGAFGGGATDAYAVRVQAGRRFQQDFGSGFGFARFVAGVELVRVSGVGDAGLDLVATDPGLAAEFAIGGGWRYDALVLGVQLGVPMTLHFDDDDKDVPPELDVQYGAADVELLFLVGARF